MSHSKQINTANAAPIAPACPARESAVELIAALKASSAVPSRSDKICPDSEQFEAHLCDLVETIRAGSEWTRPTTAEGALLHLCLGFAVAYDLPRAANATVEASMERTMFRHLHAVREYLVQTAEGLTEGFDEIFAFAMPVSDDLAPKVTDAAVAKRPRHRHSQTV